MSDARFELLKAMRLEIINDTGLATMISGVFDPPARAVAHPFVTFGETKTTPLDGDMPATLEHQVEVWVYSRDVRRFEASEIADTIRALLDDADLTLNAHTLVGLRHRDTDVAPVRDRRGFRARMRFRAVTVSNS